jgi:hypothetical protein
MNMVFFCHASEDKEAVEQILERVQSTYPDVSGWLDRHQVVGGNDLLDKIADGINRADKFIIFMSKSSLPKPWVNVELKKALMAEISGVKPEFIIPVKLGEIAKVPDFLESKLYIDVSGQTIEAWLPEIYAAITGTPGAAEPPHQDNLVVKSGVASNDATVIVLEFKTRAWAENISFSVTTRAPILEREYQLVPPQRGGALDDVLREEPHRYCVALDGKQITRTQAFAMLMKFAPGTNLASVISDCTRWDRRNPTSSAHVFLAG